jgi:F0F1-type ATP synthase assembly protein I
VRPNSPELTEGLMRSAGSYELVLSGVLFALGGLLLDRWLGTTPFLVCLGAVLGFTGATVSLYYRYRAQIAEVGSARPTAQPTGPGR